MVTIARSTAIGFAVGLGLASTTALAGDQTAWRLFVSDHEAPVVNVVDAVSGKQLDRFELRGPASLYRSASGRAVFAVQGSQNTVTAISTGISLDDHGDHGDIEVTDPKLTGFALTGDKPVHFVEHDGVFAAFFDGEGKARIFSEKAALQGKAEVREVNSGAPHHGVALAHGRHVLVSESNRQRPDELPIGIKVVDAAGATVGHMHACPDLHGEATSGNLTAFACATGILLVTKGEEGPQVRHLAYPERFPDGKATTLVGGRGLQYFLGNYGPDKIVLIDPAAMGPFRLIELPTRRVHFAVDPVRPRFAYVFTEDGRLHQVDVIAGSVTKSIALTDPYSMDGHWSDPRPRLAVAGERIVVTDPLKGVLHLVDAANFEDVGEVTVEGRPFNVVAVGGSGQTHETE